MSEAAAPETAKGDAPKKKGMLIPIIIVAVVLIAGGGGGAYWYFAKSKAEAKTEEGGEKTATAKGKSKGKAAEEEADPAEEDAPEEEAPPKKGSSVSLRLPDDSKVKQIIELQPFIVNLADATEARYLRLVVSIGLGGEEGGEEKPNPLYTTRIRNAMLAVLTARTSEEVLSNEGKAKLRRDLLRAARAAAKEPQVEAIYITEFIVQL